MLGLTVLSLVKSRRSGRTDCFSQRTSSFRRLSSRLAICACFRRFDVSIDRSAAAIAAFLASSSFFTCSELLRLTLPFSLSVDGLLPTTFRVGRGAMMDGGMENRMYVWKVRTRCEIFLLISTPYYLSRSAPDGCIMCQCLYHLSSP